MDLLQTYINEIMHNIYCHRLFLWEQVSIIIIIFLYNVYQMHPVTTSDKCVTLPLCRISTLMMELSGSTFQCRLMMCLSKPSNRYPT